MDLGINPPVDGTEDEQGKVITAGDPYGALGVEDDPELGLRLHPRPAADGRLLRVLPGPQHQQLGLDRGLSGRQYADA
jgi:hypothetical protein